MTKYTKTTICWDCKKALGKCSWSNGTARPVEGWTAIPTKIRVQKGQNNDSYIVLECPLFERG